MVDTARHRHAHDHSSPDHVCENDHSKSATIQSTPIPPTVPVAATSSILSSSVAGAGYLILLQFISRMLTFSLNQILLRYTSVKILGLASVQMELLLSTILFLSREGVRCAAIRVRDDDDGDDKDHGKDKRVERDIDMKGKVKEKEALIVQERHRLQKLVNMVYVPIPLGVIMTLVVIGYYLHGVDDLKEVEFPGYRIAIQLYGLSALLEILSEPLFMVAQYKLWFKTRVSVEGTAVLVRCVLTCGLTIFGARNISEKQPMNSMGVLAFALAQLAYGIVTLGGFLLAFWNRSAEKKAHQTIGKNKKDEDEKEDTDALLNTISLNDLLPRKIMQTGKNGTEHSTYYLDPELLKLSITLTAQSLLKHVLTEGDKMMMTGFTTTTDQGVYAFVVNYGSLIVRILFQPMEETSRTLFSKLLSNVANVKPAERLGKSGEKEQLEKQSLLSGSSSIATDEKQVQDLHVSLDLLLTLLKFHIILGLFFIAFGTNYTATVIELVVGRYWSRQTAAPAVLSLYCLYVPIMGLNGILEAVVQAVATQKELGVLSYWMIVFSAVFCTSGAMLMGLFHLGGMGIVLANCVNLTMRIVWSGWFLNGYYGRHLPATKEGKNFAISWTKVLPRPTLLAVFFSCFLITAWSQQVIGWDTLKHKVIHLGVGVVAAVGALLSIYVVEKDFLAQIRVFVRQRRGV